MSHAARPADNPVRLAAWLGFVVLFVVLQYAGRAEGAPPDDTLYRWDVFVGGLAQGLLMLAVTLAIVWKGPVTVLLALRRPSSWGAAGRYAVVTFLGVVALAAGLDPVLDASDEQGFVPDAWDPDRAAPFAANFVVAALLFPTVEELLFRGAGFSLLARLGTWAAIAGTGVLFALAHGLVNGLPILLVFGLALGWLRARSDSVVPCVLVHAAFNAFALIGVVLAGGGG